MGLREAVQRVVKDMEDDSATAYLGEGYSLIRGYIRSLSAALEANEEKPLPTIKIGDPEEIERKRQLRFHSQMADLVENQLSPPMVELADEEVCTMVQIDPKMPAGAKMEVAGKVYQLGVDRKLHYSEEETRKFLEQRARQSQGVN